MGETQKQSEHCEAQKIPAPSGNRNLSVQPFAIPVGKKYIVLMKRVVTYSISYIHKTSVIFSVRI
jgi:hypothetical protein